MAHGLHPHLVTDLVRHMSSSRIFARMKTCLARSAPKCRCLQRRITIHVQHPEQKLFYIWLLSSCHSGSLLWFLLQQSSALAQEVGVGQVLLRAHLRMTSVSAAAWMRASSSSRRWAPDMSQ